MVAECSILLPTSLEAEHQCLADGEVTEDAHKVLHTVKEEATEQPSAERFNWPNKRMVALEAQTCENLVYKVKRKALEDPAGASLTTYNLQALSKAIGKAKAHESKVTNRDVTMGKGPSDLSLVTHSDSSLLNATKFTS